MTREDISHEITLQWEMTGDSWESLASDQFRSIVGTCGTHSAPVRSGVS